MSARHMLYYLMTFLLLNVGTLTMNSMSLGLWLSLTHICPRTRAFRSSCLDTGSNLCLNTRISTIFMQALYVNGMHWSIPHTSVKHAIWLVFFFLNLEEKKERTVSAFRFKIAVDVFTVCWSRAHSTSKQALQREDSRPPLSLFLIFGTLVLRDVCQSSWLVRTEPGRRVRGKAQFPPCTWG